MITLLYGCEGEGVVLGFRGVGTGGQHTAALGALQHASRLGIAEEGDGLIEDITRHDIGEDQRIGLSVDDGMDALFAQADRVERGLQIQRAVDDATPELSRLCLGDDLEIVDGIWEGLGTHFLSTVDERDTGLLDSKRMTDIVHIVNLLTALGLGGYGYHSCIGEEEQFLVFGNLGHRHMGQHMTWTEDAVLLIQYRAQDDIGIDEALHEDIGLTILTERHRPTGTLVLIVTIHIDGFDKSHLLAFLHGITGTGIIGTHHRHTLLVAPLLEEHNHVIQCPDRLHNFIIFGFMLQRYIFFRIFASESN